MQPFYKNAVQTLKGALLDIIEILDLVFKFGICVFAFVTISRQDRLDRELLKLRIKLNERDD